MTQTATRNKRPLKLTPWVSHEEKSMVQAAAAEAGITTHEWCRRAFDFAATHMHRQQKAT